MSVRTSGENVVCSVFHFSFFQIAELCSQADEPAAITLASGRAIASGFPHGGFVK